MELARSTFILTVFAATIAAIIIQTSEGAEATRHLYVDHVICEFNPQYTVNSSCKLKFITRLIKSITIRSFITKEITDIVGHVQLYYKFRNGYQMFLVDVKTPLCDYFNGKLPSKIMDFFIPALNKYSYRNLTCPYSGWYHIKEMPLTGAVVDYMFLPVGDYLLNITAAPISGNDYFMSAKFYFVIPAGKTIEDDRMGR